MHLAYISGRHKWHLLFDEVPAVDVFEAINVPESHGIITDLIEARPYDAAYARLNARDASQLGRMARNKRADEVWQLFGDLSNRIMSPHWEVYSLMSNYQGLIRDDGAGGQLVRGPAGRDASIGKTD